MSTPETDYAWVAVFPHQDRLEVAGVCLRSTATSARCDFLEQAHCSPGEIASGLVTQTQCERWARWTEHGQQILRLTEWAAGVLAANEGEKRLREARRRVDREWARVHHDKDYEAELVDLAGRLHTAIVVAAKETR